MKTSPLWLQWHLPIGFAIIILLLVASITADDGSSVQPQQLNATYSSTPDNAVDTREKVQSLLQQICPKVTPAVDATVPELFYELVQSLHSASVAVHRQLWDDVKSKAFCTSPKLTDIFLDASAVAGNAGGVQVLLDGYQKRQLTGLQANLLFARLPLAKQPTVEAGHLLIRFLKQQEKKLIQLPKSIILGTTAFLSNLNQSQLESAQLEDLAMTFLEAIKNVINQKQSQSTTLTLLHGLRNLNVKINHVQHELRQLFEQQFLLSETTSEISNALLRALISTDVNVQYLLKNVLFNANTSIPMQIEAYKAIVSLNGTNDQLEQIQQYIEHGHEHLAEYIRSHQANLHGTSDSPFAALSSTQWLGISKHYMLSDRKEKNWRPSFTFEADILYDGRQSNQLLPQMANLKYTINAGGVSLKQFELRLSQSGLDFTLPQVNILKNILQQFTSFFRSNKTSELKQSSCLLEVIIDGRTAMLLDHQDLMTLLSQLLSQKYTTTFDRAIALTPLDSLIYVPLPFGGLPLQIKVNATAVLGLQMQLRADTKSTIQLILHPSMAWQMDSSFERQRNDAIDFIDRFYATLQIILKINHQNNSIKLQLELPQKQDKYHLGRFESAMFSRRESDPHESDFEKQFPLEEQEEPACFTSLGILLGVAFCRQTTTFHINGTTATELYALKLDDTLSSYELSLQWPGYFFTKPTSLPSLLQQLDQLKLIFDTPGATIHRRIALGAVQPDQPIPTDLPTNIEVWFTAFIETEDDLVNLTLTRNTESGTWEVNADVQLAEIQLERYLVGAVNFQQRYFYLKITDQYGHNLTIDANLTSSNVYLKLKSMQASVEMHYLPHQLNSTWCWGQVHKLIVNVDTEKYFQLQFYKTANLKQTSQIDPLFEMTTQLVNDTQDQSKQHILLSSQFNNTQLLNGSLVLADEAFPNGVLLHTCTGRVVVFGHGAPVYAIKVRGHIAESVGWSVHTLRHVLLNMTFVELTTANSTEERELYSIKMDGIENPFALFRRMYFPIELINMRTKASTELLIDTDPTTVKILNDFSPSFFADHQRSGHHQHHHSFAWPPELYQTKVKLVEDDNWEDNWTGEDIWQGDILAARYTDVANSTVQNGAEFWFVVPLTRFDTEPYIVKVLQIGYLTTENDFFGKLQFETINYTANSSSTVHFTLTTNTTVDSQMGFKSITQLFHNGSNRTDRSVVLQMGPRPFGHSSLSIDVHPKPEYRLDFEWITNSSDASKDNSQPTMRMLNFTAKTIDPEIMNSNVIAHLDNDSMALCWRTLDRFFTPVNGTLSLTFPNANHWFGLFEQTDDYHYIFNGTYDSMANSISAVYNNTLPGTLFFKSKTFHLITEKNCFIGEMSSDKLKLPFDDSIVPSYRMNTCPTSDTSISFNASSSLKHLLDGTVQLSGEHLQELLVSGQCTKETEEEERLRRQKEEDMKALDKWLDAGKFDRVFWGTEYQLIAELIAKRDIIWGILMESYEAGIKYCIKYLPPPKDIVLSINEIFYHLTRNTPLYPIVPTVEALGAVILPLNLKWPILPGISWLRPNSTFDYWIKAFPSTMLQKVAITLPPNRQLDRLSQFSPLAGIYQHVKSIAERFTSSRQLTKWNTFLEQLSSPSSFFPPAAIHYTFNQTDNTFLLNITRYLTKDEHH